MHSQNNQIVDFLNSAVAGSNAVVTTPEVGDAAVFVDASKIFDVCKALKESEEFQINVLQCITGTDYTGADADDRIEVSYLLASFIKNINLILKVKLPRPAGKEETVAIDSVCELWKAANFQERECYDMVGVTFNNHPDMRRILCPEDWEGFPLRKDYVAAKEYRGLEIYPEDKMNHQDRAFFEKVKNEAEDPKKVTFSWKGEVKLDNQQ